MCAQWPALPPPHLDEGGQLLAHCRQHHQLALTQGNPTLSLGGQGVGSGQLIHSGAQGEHVGLVETDGTRLEQLRSQVAAGKVGEGV